MSLCVDVFVRDATGKLRIPDVPDLLREVALLREHLDLIATTTDRPRELEEHRSGIELRLRIIEAASLRARETGGGIVIW
ncbi:hypothetical protein F3K43_11600 [Streptomyces sp. LBUM 1476]|nr:hypothetical protein [Streptomyces sp. LBUM 1476]MBZ3915450.1 hypothetical protein [Streptomyces acidiscabies]